MAEIIGSQEMFFPISLRTNLRLGFIQNECRISCFSNRKMRNCEINFVVLKNHKNNVSSFHLYTIINDYP